ncbi:MAG TPA: DUF4019 domain-containing protein [Candidatus Acidoferrum sp.]
MKLATAILVALFACVAWTPRLTSQTSPKPEDLARKSAESWLALTDSGKYAESWQEASASFKAAVTQDQWLSALKSVRTPAGKVLSRNLKSATYMKDPPNAPAGEYVIIQYDTAFENKKDAVETVVPTLDKDGKWRVSGCFIK